jgi:glycerate-2-kinase
MTDWTDARTRDLLRRMFDAAVAAADPRMVLPAHLPARPAGRTVVLGYGKSAALMAQVVEDNWDGPLSGVVVTRHGQAVPTRHIRVIEAAHPVPDANSALAADALLAAAAEAADPANLVLVLASGGGSALAVKPAPGLTLADKQAVNRALLASGATITEMNAVRRHLSGFKGGRLALAAHPARVITLAISDVPGDLPEVIASGPSVPDPTSFADARAIVAKYGIALPAAVAQHLDRAEDETPKPGDRRFAGHALYLVATPAASLRAAAAIAEAEGLATVILGDALEGEAREMGMVHAGIALGAARHGMPRPAPCAILSGGEATVTVRAGVAGRGGRCREFAAGLALGLQGAPGIWALAGDTDGVDGTDDAAGAFVGPDTLDRARAAGLSLAEALHRHDSGGVFGALGDALVTGPTLTNVNDFRAMLILSPHA